MQEGNRRIVMEEEPRRRGAEILVSAVDSPRRFNSFDVHEFAAVAWLLYPPSSPSISSVPGHHHGVCYPRRSLAPFVVLTTIFDAFLSYAIASQLPLSTNLRL